MVTNRILLFLLSAVIAISCNREKNQQVSQESTEQTQARSMPVIIDTLSKGPLQNKPVPPANRPDDYPKVKSQKYVSTSRVPKPVVQKEPIDYRPLHQMGLISLFRSLSKENSSIPNGPAKEKNVVLSVEKINKYITETLRNEVKSWQGIVRGITVLEHAAIEVEINCPMDVNDRRPNRESINFISVISTSDRAITDQLENLLEGDTVTFSGTIETYNNTAPPLQHFDKGDPAVLKRPQFIFVFKEIARVEL